MISYLRWYLLYAIVGAALGVRGELGGDWWPDRALLTLGTSLAIYIVLYPVHPQRQTSHIKRRR